MLDLSELADHSFDGADDVALDDEVQVLDTARLHLLEEAFERHAGGPLLGELLATEPVAAQVGQLAGATLALHHTPELARRRRLVEAEDLDRLAGLGLLDLLAAVGVERAHLPPRIARDDRVPHMQGSAMDEHRGDGPAADVQARLDDRTGCLRCRVRLQFELRVRDEEHLLQQIVEVLRLLRRHV